MNVSIKIANLKEIEDAFRRYPKEMTMNLNTAIKKSAILFHARAGSLAPKKTTFLARTHQIRYAPYRAEIYPTAKYAAYVHEGTRPHTIKAVNARVLTDGKGNFFGRIVHHPGQKAQPWLKWTKDSTDRQIQSFFKKAVTDTLNETARRAG